MTRIALPIVGLLALFALAGCGSSGSGSTTGETSTSAGPQMTVTAYFYAGAALEPTHVQVPKSTEVATAALNALTAGAPVDYTTALPATAKVVSVTIANGTATATFSGLTAPPRTAQGQIVYTLTQFPTVKRVILKDPDGTSIPLADGAETPVAAATSADYVDLTPQAAIFVAKPLRDSTVIGPVVTVSGTASVFEATFTIEVHVPASPVKHTTITATQGAPATGTWVTALKLPKGPVTLVMFEPSARDGSPQHETTVHITVK